MVPLSSSGMVILVNDKALVAVNVYGIGNENYDIGIGVFGWA